MGGGGGHSYCSNSPKKHSTDTGLNLLVKTQSLLLCLALLLKSHGITECGLFLILI